MRLMDFPMLSRSSIGFDRVFDMLETAAHFGQADTDPPYNIERHGDDAYRITVAVAGFEPDELSVTSLPNQLLITGQKTRNDTVKYLHQGIPGPTFQRVFSLADTVRVTDATLRNGLLSIDLVRQVPEPAKPRRIDIANSNQAKIAA